MNTFILGIISFCLLVVAVCFFSYAADRQQCNNIATITGKETKYDFISGCYIKLKDGWTPTKNWQNLD